MTHIHVFLDSGTAWKGWPQDVIAVYAKSMENMVTLPKYLDGR